MDIIFSTGLSRTMKLENFKTIIAFDGLSLYDEGKNTLISASMY